MNKVGIYKIQNRTNGKYYVGSSRRLERRMFYEHRWMLRRGEHFNPHLQNAWDKYGESNFDFLVVEVLSPEVSEKTLLSAEQRHLDVLKCSPQLGYNSTFIAGKVELTPAMRKAQSIRQKKWLKKNGHPLLGTHPSQETLERLSLSHRGLKLSESAKKKISGKRSVAHRQSVKEKKRRWWEQLRQNPIAYSEFCKNRAIKMAEKRYGNYAYAKNYEIIHS